MECPRCQGLKICMKCSGEGSKVCDRCGGEKVLKIYTTAGEMVECTCPICEGSGVVECPTLCELCKGFGVIKDKDEARRSEESGEKKEESQRSEAAPMMVSWVLLLANLAVLCLSYLSLIFLGRDYIFIIGGLNGVKVFHGEWWRMVTSLFIHIDIMHFFWNAYVLYYLCPPLEKKVDASKFLSLYFFAGLVGNVLTIFLKPHVWSAGASGCLYGIIGAYLGLHLRCRPFYANIIYSLAFMVVIDFIVALFPAMRINMLAHMGGLAAGIVLSFFMKVSPDDSATAGEAEGQSGKSDEWV
ncbi:MAG: rhomboid family intramembrane serine protease [Vulcanimicrobiota bacterium]